MDGVLGIDVGKADFHCALLVAERVRSNSFPNSPAGFERLLSWPGHRKVEQVHACLEATGGWSDELAAFSARTRSHRQRREPGRDQSVRPKRAFAHEDR